MADKEKSLSHEAELQRIAEQESRIAMQMVLIAKLAANGSGSGDARRTLATMENSLTALHASLQAAGTGDDDSN